MCWPDIIWEDNLSADSNLHLRTIHKVSTKRQGQIFETMKKGNKNKFQAKQQPLTPLGLSDVVMSTLGFVSPLK